MAHYTEAYMNTHDIDWFGIVNGRYIHVASCGGILPSELNDESYLRDLQYEVAMLDDIHNETGSQIAISHNDQYLQQRFSTYENRSEAIESYKMSFDSFARKGFWSFDKENINDPDDSHYRLISWPNDNVQPQINSPIRYNKKTDILDFDNPEAIKSVELLHL